MAVAIIGTPTLIESDAKTGYKDIAIPSGATGVFCGVVGFDTAGTASLFSGHPPTFGGVSMVCPTNIGDQNTGQMMGAFFFLKLTRGGTARFAWDWVVDSLDYGSHIVVGFVSGSHTTTPVTASLGAQQGSSPHASGAVTGVTNGLILSWAWEFGGTGTITWSGTGVTKKADYQGLGSGDGLMAVSASLASSATVGSVSPSSAWSDSHDGGCISLVIAPGTASAPPANTVAPVVSGTTAVGNSLSCDNGTWTDAGSPAFTKQWVRATDMGLDVPGAVVATTPSFEWVNPQNIGLPAYGPSGQGVTYIWRAYTRHQYGYYTTFFWGNKGAPFTSHFYGCHPYPTSDGWHHNWEFAINGGDYDSPATLVEFNVWHTQVARVWINATVRTFEFYPLWPSLTPLITTTITQAADAPDPANPVLRFLDAPFTTATAAFGPSGETNECYDGIIRGIQIYSNLLSTTEIATEISAPLTSAKASDIWYLNLNPTPSDISDKSGKGHHPSWVSAERPARYDNRANLAGQTAGTYSIAGGDAGDWLGCAVTDTDVNGATPADALLVGPVDPLVMQELHPDADTAAGSWAATPLWSKIEEVGTPDGTVISDTAV